MEEKVFLEEREAQKYGQAVQDAQLDFARNKICEFLGLKTIDVHPDTGEVVEMTFQQAYSLLVKEGYLLTTDVKQTNKKAVLIVSIYKKEATSYCAINGNFNVEVNEITDKDMEEFSKLDKEELDNQESHKE